MRAVLAIAGDVLREAASRKWFLGLGLAVTLLLAFLAFALRMDVVDGALAATTLFGKALRTDIRSADVALRPVFRASSYVVFYGGVAFYILACADFAPSLLSPGRIEHLLALPVRRWELLVGTFLGVIVLALAGALYGAGGFTLILAAKTGVWTARPIAAALVATVAFAAIYGAMMAAALFARSAALSAAIGAVVFVGGILAGYRDALSPLFEEGVARFAFEAVTLVLPRVSTVADAAASYAASAPVDAGVFASRMVGLVVFGLSMLALAVWRFEQKDF